MLTIYAGRCYAMPTNSVRPLLERRASKPVWLSLKPVLSANCYRSIIVDACFALGPLRVESGDGPSLREKFKNGFVI